MKIASIDKVNTSNLKVEQKYVCWIDIMGTSQSMSDSFEKSANAILRFHSAFIYAKDTNLHKIIKYKIKSLDPSLSKEDKVTEIEKINDSVSSSILYYPMMDGVYLVFEDFAIGSNIIKTLYMSLYSIFIKQKDNNRRFVIRGAIAYGEVFHGEYIENDINEIISNDKQYKDMLLFGRPMIQAHEAERNAPPFGMFIHESARLFSGLKGKFFYVYNEKEANISTEIKDALLEYFKWCRNYIEYLEMKEEKIARYERLVKEYFSDISSPIS